MYFWLVLFECSTSYKEMPQLSWSIWARRIGPHSPMNCSKIGHSHESITYLFGQNISTPLLSADLLKSGETGILGITEILGHSLFTFMGPLLRPGSEKSNTLRFSVDLVSRVLEQLMSECCPIFSCSDHESWGVSTWWRASNKKTLNQPKTQKNHANQLISGKFWSLPADIWKIGRQNQHGVLGTKGYLILANVIATSWHWRLWHSVVRNSYQGRTTVLGIVELDF